MRIALFGAAPDTPNRGVSALFMSAIAGISAHIDPVEFVVFDNGLGLRDTTICTPDGKTLRLVRFGARGGHRYHRPENLVNMLAASRLGALGAMLNRGIRLIDSCTAVLDVSGGDSFSDIYGRGRFDVTYRPKVVAINRGKPLILLPQTYGPYKDEGVRRMAASVVGQAGMAWARDSNSFNILKGLLGGRFNPEIHRCGVDMAFSLLPDAAPQLLSPRLSEWLDRPSPDFPLAGFNVSGLIYNNSDRAASEFGFAADYREVTTGFLRKLLNESSARIVLIPHVMDSPGHYESDLAACEDVRKRLGNVQADRVLLAPQTMDQSEVKWLIARMNWFCGTRMHATIAALSSGVPASTISYSDKALGVFESCGQAQQVFDPRKMGDATLIEALWRSYLERDRTREQLSADLPRVNDLASSQIRDIALLIMRTASSSARNS